MLCMAEENNTEDNSVGAAPVKFDARLAEGVAYFEQMLEIMPEDRTTLEFLVVAYDQLGQHEKGQKSLVSLTKLLIKEKDLSALLGLLPRLEASDYAPAKALLLKVNTMTGPAPDLTPEAPKELTDEEKQALAMGEASVSEVALVDVLHDGGAITDEERDQLRIHLQSLPTNGRVFLISALQILEKENLTLCEKCIEFLADKCGTPPIPLAGFEPNKQLIGMLPKMLVQLRGVVPFAKLGSLTLVATLNPVDEKLKASAEVLGPCRFYLADPASVEAMVEKVYGLTT